MYCSVCGATYADGQPVCPNCGAPAQPVQQPMGQPMNPGMASMGQPMNPGMAPMGQPMNPGMAPVNPGMAAVNSQYTQGTGFDGFMKAIKADYMKLVGMIGGLIIFLSPFFNWFVAKISLLGYSDSTTENMFSLGREYKDVRIYYLWSILLFAIGLIMICWDLADFVPALGQTKSNLLKVPYIELIVIGVGILVVIFALMNGTVNDVIEEFEDYGGKASHGVGPIVAFIGLAIAAVPRVIKMIKK